MATVTSGSPGIGRARRSDLAYVPAAKFGIAFDGSDESSKVQQALNTGENISFGGRSVRVATPVYMQYDGQKLHRVRFLMDASLAVPALYFGASDASGTALVSPLTSGGLIGVIADGNGTKTDGSAGIAIVSATTCTFDTFRCWGFYRGITVLGLSYLNTFINPDLRYNVIGWGDSVGNSTIADLQGSAVFGGRIEANEAVGAEISSVNMGFHGTGIEGNGTVTAAAPEVRIKGFNNGQIAFNDCYMETTAGGGRTNTGMIEVAASCTRAIEINGGKYFANDASNRYIIESLSSSMPQSFALNGGYFSDFKNYVKATLSGASAVFVRPTYANQNRTATTDCAVSAGATVYQIDRVNGVRFSSNARYDRVLALNALEGISYYDGRAAGYRATMASAATSMVLAAASRFASSSVYALEIILVARVSAASSIGVKFWALVNGNSGSPVLQASGILWNDAAGSPALSIVSNELVVSSLTSSVYDAYVLSFIRS